MVYFIAKLALSYFSSNPYLVYLLIIGILMAVWFLLEIKGIISMWVNHRKGEAIDFKGSPDLIALIIGIVLASFIFAAVNFSGVNSGDDQRLFSDMVYPEFGWEYHGGKP